jgi:predicted RNase H-like HicB family nuclease
MYKVWYWALIDRESDGRFVASIPDLDDVAAWGPTDKEAVSHVAQLAGDHVRACQESGQPIPRRRPASEMPSSTRPKEIGRAMISVDVGRAAATASLAVKTQDAQL